MARTAEGQRQTQANRLDQLAIRDATLAELLRLWRTVDPLRLADTIHSFVGQAVPVVQSGNRRAAKRALRYYSTFRFIEGAEEDAPPLRAAPVVPASVVENSLRGAALSGIVNARRDGRSLTVALRHGVAKVATSSSNLVAAGARQTLLGAIQRDPKATGLYSRVSGGGACDFCNMLAGRGAVYRADTAEFEAHGGCMCSVEAEII